MCFVKHIGPEQISQMVTTTPCPISKAMSVISPWVYLDVTRQVKTCKGIFRYGSVTCLLTRYIFFRLYLRLCNRFITISADLPDYPEDNLDASAGVLHAQAPFVASMLDVVSG